MAGTNDLQELARCLREELAALAAFESALEQEVLALGEVRAPEKLKTTTDAKSHAATRLHAAFERRVLAVRSIDPAVLNGDCVGIAAGAPAIRALWEPLLRLVHHAQEKNLANGRLIEGYRRYNEVALENLREAAGLQNSYTARGKALSARTKRTLATG